MSGLKLTIQAEGIEELRKSFARLIQVTGHPRAYLEDMGEYLLKSTLVRWRQEIDPQGQPWKALSPGYALSKGKKGGGVNKILQLRGRLIQSIHWHVSGTKLSLGTNVVYARVHQEGGENKIGAHDRMLAFRLNRRGELLHQSDRGMGPHRRGAGNLVVFGRQGSGGHKNVVNVKVKVKSHSVLLPARPFLGLSSTDRVGLVHLVNEHLKAALGG